MGPGCSINFLMVRGDLSENMRSKQTLEESVGASPVLFGAECYRQSLLGKNMLTLLGMMGRCKKGKHFENRL